MFLIRQVEAGPTKVHVIRTTSKKLSKEKIYEKFLLLVVFLGFSHCHNIILCMLTRCQEKDGETFQTWLFLNEVNRMTVDQVFFSKSSPVANYKTLGIMANLITATDFFLKS